MDLKGRSEDEVISYLKSRRSEDRDYSHVLGSMCTLPHPVAVRAHTLFLETNLGDPGLFPGTAEIERELTGHIATLLHHPSAGGYITSGGTESNLQALRIACSLKKVHSPNIVVPASAHFSFQKACNILGLEMRSAPLDENLRVDPAEVEHLIDSNTVALVGVAGTTEYGMVDPIDALSGIAVERDVFLHVDAAFGGLVLPFLPDAPEFDFRLPGVDSISVDPHKMGMSTIPAGCLLVRNPDHLSLLEVETPYLTVRREYTLSGTRPGAPVAAALAVLLHLGMEGMEAIVSGCMKNTRRLIDGMETLGWPAVVQPDVNVATFVCDRVPPGWQVSRTRAGHLRIVCMPHVHRETIEEFLRSMEGYVC
ncbi:MAG: tyrosine decarboxylase MfnA [Methanoculleaceae archaeon]